MRLKSVDGSNRLLEVAGWPVSDNVVVCVTSRGTSLTITPRAQGIDFNPVRHVVGWYEDIQEVPFVPRASFARWQSLVGVIEISTDSGLWLGELAMNVRALGPGERATAELPAFDSINWSSLSLRRTPTSIAPSLRRAPQRTKRLGVHLYIDRNDLTVGAEWHPGLLALIDRAEVFQLYWSESAKASDFVQREWEHALVQRGRKGARFVRGVYWAEPMVAPPPLLEPIISATWTSAHSTSLKPIAWSGPTRRQCPQKMPASNARRRGKFHPMRSDCARTISMPPSYR